MKNNILITKWLLLSLLLVLSMVVIGGITRLTDSGLSIVEWKPIAGIIPPLTEYSWIEEFTKYQASPEYKINNYGMSIKDFKFIFWLEFIHRLMGRITGIVYLLPLLYFYFTRKIQDTTPYFGILCLFGIQGFVGWYMVKSGLVQVPYISHYRLAFHLITAIVIYSALFWQLMKYSFDILLISSRVNLNKARLFCVISIILLYIQIFLGALTAGLDAGYVYNSFPLMGKTFIPEEITTTSSGLAYFNDPVFVQFCHRMGAYLLSFLIVMMVVHFLKTKSYKLKRAALATICALMLQFGLGIITIIYQVPLVIALFHQIGSLFLLSCLLWCYFLLRSV